MKYQIEVKVDFSAAHIVRGHQGKCARLHGHNWKVHVEVECRSLNEIGMGIDFSDLKKIVHEVIDPLDHQFLNEIPPFDLINPTAEEVSRFIYESVAKKLPSHVAMSEVGLFETDNSKVTYRA
jgi:6-pyruvoyltetrahydropterin/6-carboxytetrahydropterin synthase